MTLHALALAGISRRKEVPQDVVQKRASTTSRTRGSSVISHHAPFTLQTTLNSSALRTLGQHGITDTSANLADRLYSRTSTVDVYSELL